MRFEDKFIVELEAIETAIAEVYRSNSETYDSQVDRALGSVISNLKAQQKNRPSQPNSYSGVDLQLYQTISQTTQTLLEDETDLTVEDVINCLKTVRKSVKRWNKQNGRQGYLTFIDRFV
ncbi:hypothetical protein D5R81_12325 [Parashewanella spongiae]|uniref:Uncharacterized protein n=1 Tax=Parashewanella spongiae TaxID=342950 RepID=A0A3A6TW11_9GAMM|nr:hypothetical protein [Parashewanella spongiae]MCL1078750.1 hypothetical protein [Parashewanella spongiae]RJY12506.1 hypothetical protein D5R81_12325 [Parashewanella spongiae]